MYKHFTLRYEDNPTPVNAWNKKAWFSYVDDEKISIIDADDIGWYALFAYLRIPSDAQVRLREYKRLLGRISYHHADDSGGEWRLVPPLKQEAHKLRDELLDEYPDMESVIANLLEGELL